MFSILDLLVPLVILSWTGYQEIQYPETNVVHPIGILSLEITTVGMQPWVVATAYRILHDKSYDLWLLSFPGSLQH